MVVPRVEKVKTTASRFESGDESDVKPILKTVVVVPRVEKVKTTASRFESGDESDVKPPKSAKSSGKSLEKVAESKSASSKASDDKPNGAAVKTRSVDPAIAYSKVLPPSDPELNFKDWQPRNIVKEATTNIENAKLAFEADFPAPGAAAATSFTGKNQKDEETKAKKDFSIHDEEWPHLHEDSESVTSRPQCHPFLFDFIFDFISFNNRFCIQLIQNRIVESNRARICSLKGFLIFFF